MWIEPEKRKERKFNMGIKIKVINNKYVINKYAVTQQIRKYDGLKKNRDARTRVSIEKI